MTSVALTIPTEDMDFVKINRGSWFLSSIREDLSVKDERLINKLLSILKPKAFSAISIADLYQEENLEASITIQLQRSLETLENIYIFDNPERIRGFLLANEYLIDILLEAPFYIFDIFGEVPIHLELHRDPEEGWNELFVVIKSYYDAEYAAELENRLVEEWFLNRIGDTRGKLNIVEEPL